MNNAFTVNTRIIQDEMKFDDVTVLTYKIEYPMVRADRYQMCLEVVNKYYKTKAMEYQNYIENQLFPAAVEQYKYSVANNYPVMEYESLVTFRVTYNRACIISLYADRYEYTGGAHGNTVRTSQTWNLQGCRQLNLEELFGCNLNAKDYIIKKARLQISREPNIYFDDYENLLSKTFHPENFYCVPEGIIFYYQQYEIAPYSSGIREFLIAYNNCIHSPAITCF